MKLTYDNLGSDNIGAVHYITLHIGRLTLCLAAWKWRIDFWYEYWPKNEVNHDPPF